MPSIISTVKKPVIALAPMDGITDFPMRSFYKDTFPPDLLFTEFVNVSALIRGQPQVYEKLRYQASQRPIFCQLSGKEPEQFYFSTLIACFLNFDGIDINLGCPSRTVINSGGGAALIGKYKTVDKIVDQVKKGISDYRNGYNLAKLPLKLKNRQKLIELQKYAGNKTEIKPSISVKTRTGIDKPMVEEWISFLLTLNPDFISLHGRTAKQGYKGRADWRLIKKAVALRKDSPSLIFGNGDIKDQASLWQKVKYSGVDGVLIGRGALGNPWIFRDLVKLKNSARPSSFVPSKEDRLTAMLKHAACFNQAYPSRFIAMRKHLGWYCRGFKGAKQLRIKLFQATGLEETNKILRPYT